MTLIVIIVWAFFGGDPSTLGDPWSWWFIALLVAAVLDVG